MSVFMGLLVAEDHKKCRRTSITKKVNLLVTVDKITIVILKLIHLSI